MVGVGGREAGLDDEVVHKGVVAVGAGVTAVILRLTAEVAAIVGAGERNGGAVIVAAEVALVAAERVHVALAHAVVVPITVLLRHDAEDELVLVNHVGIEVHVAGAAVIVEGRQDVGGAGTDEGAQAVLHAGRAERGLLCVGDGVGVHTVPGQLAIGVLIVAVDGVAAEHHAGAVDQAVAAFPLNHGGVVGDAELTLDVDGQRVVEGTAGIVLEVELTHSVALAIVEADGAAVAIPDAVAGGDEEAHVVVAHAAGGKGLLDDDRVFGLLDAHPGLGTAHLDGIHQVESHSGVTGSGDVNLGGVGATASLLPAVAVVVVVGIAGHLRVGKPIAAALRGGGHIVVVGGDNNGLHLLPLAGEPEAVVGHAALHLHLALGGGSQRDVGLKVFL